MCWRRPTLPGGLPPSTIGAGELNYRVRDGAGCTLTAIVTNNLSLSCATLRWRAVHKNDSVSGAIKRRLLRITEDKPSTISTG